jgi:hypothetical protein
MVFSVVREWRGASGAALAGCLFFLIGMPGCGAVAAESTSTTREPQAGSIDVLTTKQAKHLLQKLPYRYGFRSVPLPKGAKGAVAGRVVGPHKTSFNFGIALGTETDPVPVPKVGTENPVWMPGAGLVFTDDLLVKAANGNWVVNPRIKTPAQDRTSVRMIVDMEQTLCRAATGEPCPV